MAFVHLSFALLATLQQSAPSAPPASDPCEVQEDLARDYVVEAVEPKDDSVPLPVASVYAPGPHGDVLVAAASGDPFFLGFAAGRYFPPAGERIDPDLAAQLQTTWTDGRPAQETYAFVMFSKRITPARLAQLEALGARVLGFHPHYCMKVALAPQAIELVSELDFVRWIGAPKSWQKVHPVLADSLASVPDGKPLEVWIDLYDSDLCEASSSKVVGSAGYGGIDGEHDLGEDAQAPRVWMSNGWQQRALQELGLEVVEYADEIRAFRARLSPAALELVTALDFVQFVEPQGEPSLMHDESMPMILVDRTRASWDGGASDAVVGAQVDSGIEYSHVGIGSYYWWQNNYTPEPGTDDSCGHGTHVAGTFHGDGDVEDSYIGAANGLGGTPTTRFFNVKHFSGPTCQWSGTSLPTVMAGLHNDVTDGNGNITPRPHVINHSWGTFSTSTPWIGTEADAREIDSEVYTYGQLHVWAAGNSGPGASSINLEASAKNAIAVGNVRDYRSGTEDPGYLSSTSSRGPTGDGRWKPNLVAPGTSITSADASTTTGYTPKSGTSMAAPHVSGLAAELCDHFSYMRYRPYTLGALLMATAMTKDNVVLTTPGATHLDNYGAGRIEALKAHGLLGSADLAYWGWLQSSGVVYGQLDIQSNAQRLVVCLFYTEPAASSGASQALVNDLDLYLDEPPLTAGATGEWTAQQSNVDNVEIRILDNPNPGTWRFKVDAASATSQCRVGLCAFVSYADTTPLGVLHVNASDTFVKPAEDVSITADAFSLTYVASAVYLDSTSSGDILSSTTVVHDDGATADLTNNATLGRDVLLGDIAAADTRSATWVTHWNTEGVKTWSVEARADNWVDQNDSVDITVDGTPPPTPTGLHSTTHSPGVWTNDPNISFAWTQPADPLSGVDGYSWSLTDGLAILPDATKDIGAVTTLSTTMPGTHGVFAFNLRPVDKSGNWQTLLTYTGFYPYDAETPIGPSSLGSTSHTPGVQSCNTVVQVNWSAASDAHSGLAGYLGVWDTSPVFDPTGATNISSVATTKVQDIGSSLSPRYFHLRARDVAGNYGTTQHFGPVLASSNLVSTYCTGKVNSLGCTPSVGWFGLPSKSIGSLTITCSNVINQKNGLLFWGATPSAAPFQGGLKCVASPTIRTPTANSGGSLSGSDCSGSYAFQFSTTYMNLLGIAPGDTLHAQFWMRDPASASTTGLSNAVRFTVCE